MKDGDQNEKKKIDDQNDTKIENKEQKVQFSQD